MGFFEMGNLFVDEMSILIYSFLLIIDILCFAEMLLIKKKIKLISQTL